MIDLNEVFVFSDLASDAIPASMITFSVVLICLCYRKEYFHSWYRVFSLFRSSFVSVVFDSSASLNDVAPKSLKMLSVCDDNEEWLAGGCLLCVHLSSQLRSSSVSVVFDFSASLKLYAPELSMSLSVILCH